VRRLGLTRAASRAELNDPSSDGDGQKQCDRRRQQQNNLLHAHRKPPAAQLTCRGTLGVIRGSPSATLMPMAAPSMAVNATEPAESEETSMAPVMTAPEVGSEPDEAGTEVMMAPAAVTVAIMPEAPKVDLLNRRRGLLLLCDASDRSRHRRSRHQPEPQRASDSAEQCCLSHICLLRVAVRRARLGHRTNTQHLH
jgi:hypothetical protein